jgi:hypothetical protein
MPRAKPTTPLICVCQFCDERFRVSASDVANGAGRFCSRACSFDYVRQQRVLTLETRLWGRVQKSDDPDGCWVWTGTKIGSYGVIDLTGIGYRHQYVHRIAWALADGPHAAGLLICHTCDVPVCLRNDTIGTYEVAGVLYPRRGHLWLGDNVANTADKVAKGRQATGARSGAYTHPERRSHGARNGKAKLADAQVIEMRLRHKQEGGTYAALGRAYGISDTQAQAIINRKRWKHLDP